MVVARHYNVSKADLLSGRRTRTIVRPRQIAMYLAKVLTPRSLPEIGRRFGGRDHTTVLHAVRKIEGLIEGDKTLAEEIELLKRTDRRVSGAAARPGSTADADWRWTTRSAVLALSDPNRPVSLVRSRSTVASRGYPLGTDETNMRATVERSHLLKSLNHVHRVVERRNTIPILSNVLLRADGGADAEGDRPRPRGHGDGAGRGRPAGRHDGARAYSLRHRPQAARRRRGVARYRRGRAARS